MRRSPVGCYYSSTWWIFAIPRPQSKTTHCINIFRITSNKSLVLVLCLHSRATVRAQASAVRLSSAVTSGLSETAPCIKDNFNGRLAIYHIFSVSFFFFSFFPKFSMFKCVRFVSFCPTWDHMSAKFSNRYPSHKSLITLPLKSYFAFFNRLFL